MTLTAPTVPAAPAEATERRPLPRSLWISAAVVVALVGMGIDAGNRSATLVLGTETIRSGPIVNVHIWKFTAVEAALVAVAAVAAGWWRRRLLTQWSLGVAISAAMLGYLVWAPNGSRVDLSNILVATISGATPLLLGSTAGVLSERAGMINIAIEGEFLGGACIGAFIGSIAHSDVWGLFGAIAAGVAIGLLLSLLTIRYGVDQIVGGIILTTLVTGATSFFVEQTLDTNSAKYNTPPTFGALKIPLLNHLPIVGKAVFSANILFYLAVIAIVAVEWTFKRSTVGLRIRASGENPSAAMSSGINVRRLRYGVGALAGGIAGIGGAFFTLGSSGAFVEETTAGLGYVALAAVIFGSWRASRAALAALLFGFAVSLSTSLSLLNVSVNPDLVLTIPYLVTIAAVALTAGTGKAPAADGVPLPQG
jgi:general nucleoside transport system permease protein